MRADDVFARRCLFAPQFIGHSLELLPLRLPGVETGAQRSLGLNPAISGTTPARQRRLLLLRRDRRVLNVLIVQSVEHVLVQPRTQQRHLVAG